MEDSFPVFALSEEGGVGLFTSDFGQRKRGANASKKVYL